MGIGRTTKLADETRAATTGANVRAVAVESRLAETTDAAETTGAALLRADENILQV
jgi:hypothetical protein